jgi:hypothetical protein
MEEMGGLSQVNERRAKITFAKALQKEAGLSFDEQDVTCTPAPPTKNPPPCTRSENFYAEAGANMGTVCVYEKLVAVLITRLVKDDDISFPHLWIYFYSQ